MAALILPASVAILLSVAGLYALMSFTVTQRTREIGIRWALGARRRQIVVMVAQQAALQLLAGVSLGVAGSLWMFREMAGDWLTTPDGRYTVLTAIALGTLLVGGIACVRPTARGLRLQPTEALREE
jgi:putative ABC transport system permease protein